jgi:hypothetical protein
VDAVEDVADKATGEALELAILGAVLAAGALEVTAAEFPRGLEADLVGAGSAEHRAVVLDTEAAGHFLVSG